MTVADLGPSRITRTVTISIRGVISESGRSVLDTFVPLWQRATRLANWAQRELVIRDIRRTADMETMPAYDRRAIFGEVPRRFARKTTRRVLADGTVQETPAKQPGEMSPGSLYDLFTRTYPDRAEWDGATVTARDVLKAVEDTWKKHPRLGRFAVLWRCEARAAVYRYPYPWLVPADKGKTLRLMRAEPNRPMVSIPMPGEAEDRVLLRLADGREFRRQLRQFDILLSDPTRLRQGRITGRRSGGRLVGADLRLVGSFDAVERVEGVTARVETGADCVLKATVGDGEPFVIYADHLRGLIHAYDRWRYRLARDLKYEKRWPAEKRRRIIGGKTVQSQVEKIAQRIDAERQQMAACLTGWLRRQGVANVEYDDSETGYFDWTDPNGHTHRRFDLTKLREVIRCACEDCGISMDHVAGGDDDIE